MPKTPTKTNDFFAADDLFAADPADREIENFFPTSGTSDAGGSNEFGFGGGVLGCPAEGTDEVGVRNRG